MSHSTSRCYMTAKYYTYTTKTQIKMHSWERLNPALFSPLWAALASIVSQVITPLFCLSAEWGKMGWSPNISALLFSFENTM